MRCIRLTEERTRRKAIRLFLKSFDVSVRQRYFRVMAPAVFSITSDVDHRKEVLFFIARLREVCESKRHVVISFAKTRKMFTCGTLLFYSELRNILNRDETIAEVRMLQSSNLKVMQVLKQIGLMSILQYSNSIEPTFDDVVKWKFTFGNNVNGPRYEDIAYSIDGGLEEKTREGLFKAFSEAMTNTHQHAYIEMDGVRSVAIGDESWWAFSQVKNGYIHIVFCDLGIGIPGSLPMKRPDWVRDITARIGFGDAEVIQGAVHISRSRTGLDNRGKGLKQLVEAIKEVDAGHLLILSRKGGYRYQDGEERTHNYRDSIDGTLIEWKLPLPRARGACI